MQEAFEFVYFCLCKFRSKRRDRERKKKMAEKFELGDANHVEVKQPKEEAKEMEPSNHGLPNTNSDRYVSPFLISVSNLQGIFGCISSICEDI